MNLIKSRTSKEITQTALLLDNRKERRAQGLFVAEGIRTVSTLIDAGVKLRKLYLLELLPTTEIDSLTKLCAKKGFSPELIMLVTTSVLEKISDTTSPSGIVGVFAIPTLSKETPLDDGVVLANISSPGNMGTIIRTAAALNKKTVVIVDGADAWSPKVIQASAGTVGLVNIIECSWQELVARKKNIPLCALVVSGGESPSLLGSQKTLLVVGNEAHGLPAQWVANCNKKITLPMPGNVESLNAALAVSIAMYVGYLEQHR